MTQFALRRGGRIHASMSRKVFCLIAYSFLALLALACLLPFIMLISGSFSSEKAISFTGFGILPKEFTTEAYRTLLKNPLVILRAYGVSALVTVLGTAAGLLVTALTGYVLSRRDFRYRNRLSFFFYFTTLFNGGMVCTYIFVIRYLGLKDTYLSLILPHMINVFYLLIMRSFMKSVPVEIIESAKVDGAGEWRIFFQLVLPLSKAGLATIGLFMALNYWNDWHSAMLYISSRAKFPLQYMLYDMLSQSEGMAQMASEAGVAMMDLPSQSLKMAMAVVATGPIVFLYPFVQRYFVQGITIGAVKG